MTSLTGLSEPELDRWLVEVRKVAALTGQAARDACDVLIWAIREAEDRPDSRDAVPDGSPEPSEAAWQAWQVTEDLSRLAETVARLRAAQTAGTLQPWDGSTLARQADNVGHLAGKDARESMAADIQAARADAQTLAAGIEVTFQRQTLVTYSSKPIVNASSIPGIVGGIDRALAELRRLGALTAEDEAAARAGKMRAAHYRSDRKMEEAEVAAAGGNLKKAERLRAEAGVMLRQDMARAGMEP